MSSWATTSSASTSPDASERHVYNIQWFYLSKNAGEGFFYANHLSLPFNKMDRDQVVLRLLYLIGENEISIKMKIATWVAWTDFWGDKLREAWHTLNKDGMPGFSRK
jgi:hypothetical protein